MLRNSLGILILFLVFWLIATASARTTSAQSSDNLTPPGLEPSVRFIHLTTADGLANNRVEVIFQDSQGFMWIGTWDGLNRYDGYRFTVYRHDPNNPDSLSGNRIHDIIEDNQGRLWVASGPAGVTLFDPHTERFSRFLVDPANSDNGVFTLFQDSHKVIWLGGMSNGLSRFDPATETITRYPPDPDNPHGFQDNIIWEIIEDRSGQLWLAASSALVKFDPRTEQFTRYVPTNDTEEIRTVYEDAAGNIWLNGSAMHKFDPTTETFTHYPTPVGDAPIIRTLADRKGNLWVATLNGLFRFNLQTEQFTHHYSHRPTDPGSLSGNRLFSLYEDRAGVIWIGTENAGLNLFDPRQTQFTYYRHDPANPLSLGAARVNSIYGDESGLLWLGTDTVLNRFDPASRQISHYTPDPTSSPSPFGISAIYRDREGLVWFGLRSRLYRFDEAQGAFTGYEAVDEPSRPGPPVYIAAIYEDPAGSLWLGVNRGQSGLLRFDRRTETFQVYASDPANPNSIGMNSVQAIYGDTTGELWLASVRTLSRFDQPSDRFHNYQTPYESANDLYKDPNGALWIAADDGLYRFEPGPERFTRYTDQEGLPANGVMAILADRMGNLWLSTRKGLSRFDPRVENFRNYDVDDGLQGNEFLVGSAWQMADGRMIFGGEQGLTAFYPDQISDNPYQPPLVLTEARLFNEPLPIGEDSLLPQAIWQTDHLTFNYDQNIISFEFAALSYAAPHKNRYRYKLEGFEEEWNEVASDRRFASYTNLPAGEYVFRVQGTNDSGLWSDQEVALNITVLPPWWETIGFRAGLLVALIGLVYGGYRWRVRSIEQNSRRLEAQVAERTREAEQARAVAETLRAANIALTQSLDLDPILETMLDYLSQVVPYDSVTIMLIGDGSRLTARAVRGYERFCDPALARAVSFDFRSMPHIAPVVDEQTSLLIPDTQQHPHWVVVPSSVHVRNHLAVPLVASGQTIGLFFLDKAVPNFFTHEHQRLAEALAAQAAVAIQNAALFESESAALQQAESRARELARLNRVAQAVNSVLDLQAILEIAAREIAQHLNARGCDVALLNPTRTELTVVAYASQSDARSTVDLVIPLASNLATQQVIETHQSIAIADAQHTPLQDEAIRAVFRARNTHSLLLTPLLARGEVIGSMGTDTDLPDRVFTPEEARLAETIASQVAGAIENARLFKETQDARAAAEAANQAKSAFLANMSHELRSPLSVILGFTQVIRRKQELPRETHENLGVILRSGEHLLTLINQVLDFSKIEAGHITLNETDVDLYRLLDDLEDMFALKADDKQLQLIFDRPADLPRHIRTDEVKLRQVLINLLSNALKFTEKGDVTLRVTGRQQTREANNRQGEEGTLPRLPSTGYRLRFEVEDTGPGIPPNEIDKLFEAFAQTETGRQAQEGTGLGLPISRKFIQLMGGDITVKSQVGQGTIFKFNIQCQVVASIENLKSTPLGGAVQNRIVALELGQPHYRILVVDDKWANRQLLIKLLNPLGFELREAQNGQEALEVWQEFEPHLIWMDIRMPVMDGFEATRRIKATTTGQATAIIALTASSLEEERAIVLSAGCDDFVRKPFHEAEIFEMMSKHIGVHYVYEEASIEGQDSGVRLQVSLENLKSQISALPTELLAQLREGTELGDMEMIDGVIAEIRWRHPALAEGLARLASSFEYDKMLNLIQGRMNEPDQEKIHFSGG